MKTIAFTAAVVAILATPILAAGNPGSGFITNWDGDDNNAVSLAEVIEKRENVFVTFDEDGDGIITAEEYIAFDEARAADQAYESNGNGGHGKASMGMTLEFNDSDGDGAVSLAEFVGRSEAWFAILDRNGDAVVTSADFGRW